MDSNSYEPHYYYLNEIYIMEIVFDESESVTIFGYLYDEKSNKLKRWDFLCTFSILTDVLLFAGDKGDSIIKVLSEKLTNELEIPSIIDIKDIIGDLLKIDSVVFTVYKTHEKNEFGVWEPIDEACVFIDSIEANENFFLKNPQKYISKLINNDITADLLDEAFGSLEKESTFKKELEDYMLILDNAYKYYLLLVDKGFAEKFARKKAGLNDELLYRIAFLNHELIKCK